MKKKPLAILVTGLGKEYLDLSHKMISSLKKTNPDIEKVADIKLYTEEDARRNGFTMLPNDLKMRYMTPIFMKELLQEYECVVRLDSDQIITGDISHVWEGDFDVAVVQNGNPRELASQMRMMGRHVAVWDIRPLEDYVNCGFVVVKSERFVDNWLKLCTPERQQYQFYEQDFLNILCYYGDYKVKFLDKEDNKWHGLISKGYWSELVLKDKKLILPDKSGSEIDQWPVDGDKEIICLHVAGGADPSKFNYDWLPTRFQPEVADYLKYLVDDGNTKTQS